MYSTIREVQAQINCFAHGSPKDRCPTQHRPPQIDWSAIYQVNADPSNPLRCVPSSPQKKKKDK